MNSLKSALVQLETQLTTKEATWKRIDKQLHQQIDSLKRSSAHLKKKNDPLETTSFIKRNVVDSIPQHGFHSYSMTPSISIEGSFAPTTKLGEIDSKKPENSSLIVHYSNKDIKKVSSSISEFTSIVSLRVSEALVFSIHPDLNCLSRHFQMELLYTYSLDRILYKKHFLVA